MLNKMERQEMLTEAQELLRQAIELITEAVEGTNVYLTADAYTIPTLEKLIDNESQWLGRNPGDLQGLSEDMVVKEEE